MHNKKTKRRGGPRRRGAREEGEGREEPGGASPIIKKTRFLTERETTNLGRGRKDQKGGKKRRGGGVVLRTEV